MNDELRVHIELLEWQIREARRTELLPLDQVTVSAKHIEFLIATIRTTEVTP